jgi:hypothetical protein
VIDRNRWIAVLLAVAGIGICVVALVGFLLSMIDNNLPWYPNQTARDYYLAVGDSYSQGFTVGFFLCFFLTMMAVSIGALVEKRRRKSPAPIPSRSTR